MTSLYSNDIFWFYFSGLSNRIMRKNLVTGDWSQSNTGYAKPLTVALLVNVLADNILKYFSYHQFIVC